MFRSPDNLNLTYNPQIPLSVPRAFPRAPKGIPTSHAPQIKTARAPRLDDIIIRPKDEESAEYRVGANLYSLEGAHETFYESLEYLNLSEDRLDMINKLENLIQISRRDFNPKVIFQNGKNIQTEADIKLRRNLKETLKDYNLDPEDKEFIKSATSEAASDIVTYFQEEIIHGRLNRHSEPELPSWLLKTEAKDSYLRRAKRKVKSAIKKLRESQSLKRVGAVAAPALMALGMGGSIVNSANAENPNDLYDTEPIEGEKKVVGELIEIMKNKYNPKIPDQNIYLTNIFMDGKYLAWGENIVSEDITKIHIYDMEELSDKVVSTDGSVSFLEGFSDGKLLWREWNSEDNDTISLFDIENNLKIKIYEGPYPYSVSLVGNTISWAYKDNNSLSQLYIYNISDGKKTKLDDDIKRAVLSNDYVLWYDSFDPYYGYEGHKIYNLSSKKTDPINIKNYNSLQEVFSDENISTELKEIIAKYIADDPYIDTYLFVDGSSFKYIYNSYYSYPYLAKPPSIRLVSPDENRLIRIMSDVITNKADYFNLWFPKVSSDYSAWLYFIEVENNTKISQGIHLFKIDDTPYNWYNGDLLTEINSNINLDQSSIIDMLKYALKENFENPKTVVDSNIRVKVDGWEKIQSLEAVVKTQEGQELKFPMNNEGNGYFSGNIKIGTPNFGLLDINNPEISLIRLALEPINAALTDYIVKIYDDKHISDIPDINLHTISDETSNIENILNDAYEVRVLSPANPMFIDEQGRQTGFTEDGKIIEEIPNSLAFKSKGGAKHIIALGQDNLLKTKLIGTDYDEYDMILKKGSQTYILSNVSTGKGVEDIYELDINGWLKLNRDFEGDGRIDYEKGIYPNKPFDGSYIPSPEEPLPYYKILAAVIFGTLGSIGLAKKLNKRKNN